MGDKPVTFYKVSAGTRMLFESLSKDEAVSYAQVYYSRHRVIPDIAEFLRVPADHR